MRKKLYNMNQIELEQFHEVFTFEDIVDMKEDELNYIDRGYLEEQIILHEFDDIVDAINVKTEYNIELNEEEQEYSEWGDKVDYDLGPPLMSSETLLNL